MGGGDLAPYAMRSGCEIDNPPPGSEIKNECVCFFLYAFTAWTRTAEFYLTASV